MPPIPPGLRFRARGRRAAPLLIFGLLLALPREARACDPNCDVVLAAVFGVPSLLGTTIAAPLVGRVLDDRPQSPYWTAVGATAVASGAAVFLAASGTDELHGGGRAGIYRMVALPAVAGALTTTLVYRYWPRGGGETAARLREPGSPLSVDPWVGPRSAGVRLRF